MKEETTTRVAVTLLMELINAAKQGNLLFKQMGIDTETMNDLATMNISELNAVAATPFVNYQINVRNLNMTVQRILRSRNRDDLLNSSIKHGASRTVMKLFANMTHKEFNQRRSELNIDDIRSRPSLLSEVQYDELATLHSRYGQNNPLNEKLDHLRCLLYLSERMSLDINQIYQYFYVEHQAMFLSGEAI